MGVGRLPRLHDLIETRAGLAVTDILRNGSAEQKGLLQDNADLGPQILQPKFPDIHPVDLDGSSIDVVKPANQVHRGGLSHTRLAHKPDHLARFDVQFDVEQHGFGFVIAKGHVSEPHPAFHLWYGGRIGIRVSFRRRIDDLEDALGPHEGACHPVIDHSKPLQWTVKQPHITIKRHQRAE